MSELLDGILTSDLIGSVVGRPVKTPLGLMHEGAPDNARKRHILFVVEAGKSVPCAVVKWAEGAAAQSLYTEQEALERLQSHGDRALAARSPHSLGPLPVGAGGVVAVQSYVPGRSLYAQFRTSVWPRRMVAAHFRAVGNWLVRFNNATRLPGQPLDEALIGEHIEQPLAEARGYFGRGLVPDTAYDEALRQARLHRGCSVSLVDEHGDFWPSNLLLAGHQLHVIDWEHFRMRVPAGFDMLVFCAAYNLNFPWRPFGWADASSIFARTFLRGTMLSENVEALLGRGCVSGGLPPELVPVMLPVALCRMAVRRAEGMPREDPVVANPWLQMLSEWWKRPTDNRLEAWASREESRRGV